MDNEAMRCSVFLTPAGDDYAYLDKLIREICAGCGLTPFEPHVTLYSGTFTDPPLLEKAVDAAVAGVSPISLTVRGVAFTTEYFKTLYIEFDEQPLLRRIHERLKEECGDLSPYRLAPHLSLLYADLPLREKVLLAGRITLDRGEMRFAEVRIVTPLNRAEGWRDTMQWRIIYRAGLSGKGV
jgi:putative hydrolase of the HAD superfamily